MKRMTILTLLALAALSCSDPAVEEYKPSENGNGIVPVPSVQEKGSWAALADSCTNVLVANFLDKNTGTF